MIPGRCVCVPDPPSLVALASSHTVWACTATCLSTTDTDTVRPACTWLVCVTMWTSLLSSSSTNLCNLGYLVLIIFSILPKTTRLTGFCDLSRLEEVA